jgi:hypothetical protein
MTIIRIVVMRAMFRAEGQSCAERKLHVSPKRSGEGVKGSKGCGHAYRSL